MMRFPIVVTLSLVFAGWTGGCGLVGMPGGSGSETGSPKLRQFSSEAELSRYLSGEMTARGSSVDFGGMGGGMRGDGAVFDDVPAGMPVPEAGQGAGDGALASQDAGSGFSGTTLQEAGVDESDVVKTDGDYLYLMDNARTGGSLLRIVSVGPDGPMSAVSETALTGYGQQLYLYGGKVVALTTDAGYFGGSFPGEPVPVDFVEGSLMGGGGPVAIAVDAEGVVTGQPDDATTMPGFDGMGGMDRVAINPVPVDGGAASPGGEPVAFVAPEFEYRRPRTVVTVVDVSDPAAPAVLSETKFDGTPASSRLIDGVLHLVVSNFESFFFDVMPMMGRPGFDATVTDATTVLPTFTRTNADGTQTTGSVVTWEDMYRPTDPDGFGVVTVISMDMDADAAFTALGVAAEPGLVYSSTDALYLTDTVYDVFGTERETTDIYKFAYSGRGVVASATGSVPGRVLNQYSMSEHDGSLRVASTLGPRFGFFGPVSPSSNGVYVLQENGSTLETVGSIAGIASGERLQTARFMEDRGYVVTFQQVDPLFTLDLTDPTNPQMIGELEVPGFSTFIVPMDANHLLTVGQFIPPPGEFGPWGVQVSIFDVTDFANPQRTSNVILGADTGAYSEALFNPKAFTYYAERGLVALPISIFEDSFFFRENDAGFDMGMDGDMVFVDSSPEPVEPSAVDVVGVSEEPLPVGEERFPVEPMMPFVPGGFEGVVVLSASAEFGLSEVGRVSTRYPDANIYYSNYTRGVFIGDDVCAVTNRGVRRVKADDAESVVGELVFE